MCRPLSGTEPNLAAYWRLDERAGSTAFDSTTNGYNGTVNGPRRVGSSIPPWGSALGLAGLGNARVQTAGFAAFPSNAITVEFWMQSADTNHDGTPFSYATSASDNTFLVFNYRNFQVYRKCGGTRAAASPTSTPVCQESARVRSPGAIMTTTDA